METENRNLEVSKLFKEVVQLLKHKMSKGFEDYGITLPQGMVIGVLSRSGKMKISELSKQLSLSNSTVSGIIDRLEKQDIVERERSEEDKRVVYVTLSPKFEERHQHFHKKMDGYLQNILNKGTPEDLQKIIEGLDSLKRLLSEQQK